ncbi:MAG: ATP-binding cassette domain-containing protein [Hydrotalea sp.]|nr:ATP-binding cassette domain-containing protein [Hydrotalea sp.]
MAKTHVFCYGFFMLVAQKLSFARGRVMIFSNFSCKLKDGDVLWLVGDNGAGKTTLLKTLLGRLPATGGDVTWQNKKNSYRPGDEEYQSACFYLGHKHGGAANMQGDITVDAFLRFSKKLWRGVAPVEDVAKTLQLHPHLSKKIKELSSGMQKKLQLAAMLWAGQQEPTHGQKKIWLLDEPFTALDDKTKKWLWQWLAARARRGDNIIFTSHDNLMGNHGAAITGAIHKKIKKIYL